MAYAIVHFEKYSRGDWDAVHDLLQLITEMSRNDLANSTFDMNFAISRCYFAFVS